MLSKLETELGLSKQETEAMRDMAHETNGVLTFDIQNLPQNDRELLMSFARKFGHMTPKQKAVINRTLND